MNYKRHYRNRISEKKASRAVWKLCSELGCDYYWEGIPKLIVCPSCRRPLLIMTHAFTPSPNCFVVSFNLSRIATRLAIPYILVTFTVNPPRIAYKVIGKGEPKSVVSVDEFFGKVYPRLLGDRCSECGRYFKHTPRKSFAELKINLPNISYEYDSLTFELIHRELPPKWHSSIDIDAIIFSPDEEPFAVIEVSTYTNGNIFHPKKTCISERFAQCLGVPFFVLYIPFSGVGNWGIVSYVSRRRLKGCPEEVAAFVRDEAKKHETMQIKSY